jgi:hypothetical protein
VSEGLGRLAFLWNSLNKNQKKERTEAYAKIRTYIQNAPPYGIPPNFTGKSFTNTNRRIGSARIDLVVDAGVLFDVP